MYADKRKPVGVIKQAITVGVGIANITDTITVDIRLIRIGQLRTVVRLIRNAIFIEVNIIIVITDIPYTITI